VVRRDGAHAVALEAAVLAAFTPDRPRTRKANRPPSDRGKELAAAIRGDPRRRRPSRRCRGDRSRVVGGAGTGGGPMTAPSPNQTYQQLRAHLAYLKLDAAADALAQVLDDADGASHVEILETLLGIEAEATATWRRESRRRLAGLPAEHRLADFDTDAQPAVTDELLRDLGTLRWVDDGGNVLFIGPPSSPAAPTTWTTRRSATTAR
jgi:hypothetical protein